MLFMIKSITVTNHLAESITLELVRPEKSGFLIRGVTGLGAGKAVINSTELSSSDGSVFNSSKVASRNIVLDLLLLDFPTVETSRQRSYKYFPIKKRITLLIETDNRLCEIAGYVESNEPSIFSEQSSTQISIICPDPYFYSKGQDGQTVTVFSGVEAQFEFPMFNDSLVSPLLNMGNVVTNQQETIYYDGDADVGVTIYIHALASATDLTISNSNTREIMKINSARLIALTGAGITAGDDIIISTVKGNKYIQLLRGGLYINILNCLERNTDWIRLVKGDNIFSFVAVSGATNLQYRVENATLYEGV